MLPVVLPLVSACPVDAPLLPPPIQQTPISFWLEGDETLADRKGLLSITSVARSLHTVCSQKFGMLDQLTASFAQVAAGNIATGSSAGAAGLGLA